MHDRPQWMAWAECAKVDPDLFFPGRGDNGNLTAAKAVCATCPVRKACLNYAMENGEKFGVWGGKSERERRSMRRLRSAA